MMSKKLYMASQDIGKEWHLLHETRWPVGAELMAPE
ncbi:unnamed protein product [Victoria cruziana]